MDTEKLESIMAAIQKTSIKEAEVTTKDGYVRLVRRQAAPVKAVAPAASGKAGVPAAAVQPEAPKPKTVDVRSSWVGYFGRGKGKDGKPCVALRDVVKEGQQVGVVTTMNIRHDVDSPVAGKVVEILVEDGQPVEYNQPLVRIAIEE